MDNTVQSFRPAFHGFNRDDVVHYLENLTNQHTIRVNQLTDDLKRAEDALAEKEALAAQQAEALSQLEARVEELTAALDEAASPEAAQEAEHIREENAALAARVAELEAQLAEKAAEPETDWGAQELTAYRRAESMERLTRGRASALCHQTNDLVSSITRDLAANRKQLDLAAEAMGKALEDLQTALDNSCATLEKGSADFGALKLEMPQE